ncbi:HdeD family acid-resistance protein [Planotetraspora sp. A-T 1434]|uniref:HdeD family acid-resistance protein n=1 Tax=Planotetraspora sp. A-T 1434 TaxID=2979219 RepID=UPI0021BEC0EE|nr:HdeD family acid-resistance protein [Planotetraspora sp. A-T 1434]MCT9930904.1 HdeD family acid-resistance protein [Planotetraspora sp. A-T 1434]
MRELLSSNWWLLALRGALAILFGIVALVWPGITLLALVILFGAYAIVNGVFELAHAIRGTTGQSRGWLVFSGVISIIAGILAFVWPGITTLALLFVIAAWFVVTGIFEIAGAIAMRRQIEGEWLLVLSGAVLVVFGVLLFIWPASGALALVWLIGVSAIVFGVSLLILAFRVRGLGGSAYAGGRHEGPAPAV